MFSCWSRSAIPGAVLAREMNAEEIAQVCRGTTMEIETFVHGALCMCLSGQCYLSAVAGERSGNRGLCAQPCRLPFYEKNPQRCGLSLKDMSLFSHIDELRQAGVCSLKIEGRMKRPEYVAGGGQRRPAALAGEKPDLHTLQAFFPVPALRTDILPAAGSRYVRAPAKKRM